MQFLTGARPGVAEELADRPAAVADALEGVDGEAHEAEDNQRDECVGEEDCRKKVSLCS